MTSLLLLGAVVMIGLVIIWSIKNDGRKTISDQDGIFRMKNHEEKEK